MVLAGSNLIPADAIVIECKDLHVEEAALTGACYPSIILEHPSGALRGWPWSSKPAMTPSIEPSPRPLRGRSPNQLCQGRPSLRPADDAVVGHRDRGLRSKCVPRAATDRLLAVWGGSCSRPFPPAAGRSHGYLGTSGRQACRSRSVGETLGGNRKSRRHGSPVHPQNRHAD
ncbi:hypothetical protein [Devosia psychrophila]|uniref:hypothetical protein n=1 Tax=Devosia psychrophila TaxID=728005 RepID=UPI0020C041AE|nr:hypothetical protein [Devosia psychrophila]